MPVSKNTIVAGNTYKTRDGRTVTVFATTAAGDQPVIGQIAGDTKTHRWHSDGRYSTHGGVSDRDIVFTFTTERFANIYAPNVYENPALYRDLDKTRKMVTGFKGGRTPKEGILKITYTWQGDEDDAILVSVTSDVLPA